MVQMVRITEQDLRAAMREPRYWQPNHAERQPFNDWVTQGWAGLNPADGPMCGMGILSLPIGAVRRCGAMEERRLAMPRDRIRMWCRRTSGGCLNSGVARPARFLTGAEVARGLRRRQPYGLVRHRPFGPAALVRTGGIGCRRCGMKA
jgi:hypothetical protein